MDRVDFLDKLPYFYNNGITSPILKAEEKERNILKRFMQSVKGREMCYQRKNLTVF